MRDEEVRLTSIYVAPTGSTVPSHSPNSEDAPAVNFDLIITGEEGDEIRRAGSAYTLSYWAVDLFTMTQAPGPFNNAGAGGTLNNADWIARGAGEDFFTFRKFTITPPVGGGQSGHVLQYFAVLTSQGGDLVSFVRSEPFVLV